MSDRAKRTHDETHGEPEQCGPECAPFMRPTPEAVHPLSAEEEADLAVLLARRGTPDPDALREAAQAVVDALPDPIRILSDGSPHIDTLTVRSPQIVALRAALAAPAAPRSEGLDVERVAELLTHLAEYQRRNISHVGCWHDPLAIEAARIRARLTPEETPA